VAYGAIENTNNSPAVVLLLFMKLGLLLCIGYALLNLDVTPKALSGAITSRVVFEYRGTQGCDGFRRMVLYRSFANKPSFFSIFLWMVFIL
jgi:hypothetical protein